MANTIDDLGMPKAITARIIKGVLPAQGQVQKDARSAMTRACTVFISYVTSTLNFALLNSANDITKKRAHKTINVGHVYEALQKNGFESFIPTLQAEMEAYAETQRAKKNQRQKKAEENAAAALAAESGEGDAAEDAMDVDEGDDGEEGEEEELDEDADEEEGEGEGHGGEEMAHQFGCGSRGQFFPLIFIWKQVTALDPHMSGNGNLEPNGNGASDVFGTSPVRNALAKLRSPSPLGDSLENNVWASASAKPATTPASNTGAPAKAPSNPVPSATSSLFGKPAVVATPVPPAVVNQGAAGAEEHPHPHHHLNADVIRRVTAKKHQEEKHAGVPEIVADNAHRAQGSASNVLHHSNSANSFASIAAAAIQADRFRAPARSEGQLPGAERASGHGRHVGPARKFILHEYAVFSRLVQIAICLWLLVGVVLGCTIFAAVAINVSYAAFNASRETSIWPLLIGLAFFIELGYIITSSFVRTGVRLQMYVWGANFGNDPDSDIFPIYLFAPYLTSLIASIILRKKAEEHPEAGERDPLLGEGQAETDGTGDIDEDITQEELIAWRVDIAGHLTVVISRGICISSLIFIVAINVIARTYRTYLVLNEIWKHPEEMGDTELRATYYSSTGFDTGKDIYTFIITKGLSSSSFVLAAALAFSHFNPHISILIVTGFFVAVFLIGHLPHLRQMAYSFQKRTFWQPNPDYRKSEGYALYNGAEEWPSFIAFGCRCAIFIIGFACLMYFDVYWKRKGDSGDGHSALEVGVHRTVLFLLVVIAHDVALLLPVVRYQNPERPYLYTFGKARVRVLIMVGLIVAGVALSVTNFLLKPCFSSSVSVVVAFLTLSYRHPRCRWTNYQRTFKAKKFSKEARLERRATRNARNTLIVVLLVLSTSWMVALLIGMITPEKHGADGVVQAKSSFKIPSLRIPALGLPESYQARNVSSLARSIHRPTVCGIRVSKGSGLDILDVGAMARGSYEPCMSKAEDILRSRPRLQGWVAFNSTNADRNNCENPEGNDLGVQWMEFRSVNETDVPLSIVAVRGTSNVNDVFQDLYLWSTSALLQLSSFFGTMVTVWPTETVNRLADMIMKFGPLDSTLVYWNEVQDRVEYLLSQNRTVIMTGHSLGGAIASIVASHLNISSFAFSAPGLGYSMTKYGISKHSLQRYTMNVVPSRDAVPCFDLQVGLIQTIPCEENEFLSCHSLDLTIATLKQECEGEQ
ncbi:hypothetical protein HDU96_002218 [Phlyctochytrium bullatum]|nr:hypothetical protein HDU96_002218 [Phlyctochytrium bullatum]